MKQKPCQIPMKTTNNYNYFYVLQFENRENHNKLLPNDYYNVEGFECEFIQFNFKFWFELSTFKSIQLLP